MSEELASEYSLRVTLGYPQDEWLPLVLLVACAVGLLFAVPDEISWGVFAGSVAVVLTYLFFARTVAAIRGEELTLRKLGRFSEPRNYPLTGIIELGLVRSVPTKCLLVRYNGGDVLRLGPFDAMTFAFSSKALERLASEISKHAGIELQRG